MAKEVKWTDKSIKDRVEIYKYWAERNKSEVYSRNLDELFEKSARAISIFPLIGTPTNYKNVYAKIVRDYKIFYRLRIDEVQILRVWDTRRNPTKVGL